MKKVFVIFTIMTCMSVLDTFAWGRLGHDAISYIAECNLKPKTKKIISKYLNNKSIVYYSSWMDEVRETEEYAFTTRWHSFYLDSLGRLLLKNPDLPEVENNKDALSAVLDIMQLLEDYKEQDDSTVVVGIKMLVHLIGDMHCPGHVKYYGIEGFNVYHMGSYVKYHSVWDDGLIGQVHKWGYMEYGHQFGNLDRRDINSICKGGPVEWCIETSNACTVIYDWAYPDAKLGKIFNNTAKELADMQICKAGYRLSYILNKIFNN